MLDLGTRLALIDVDSLVPVGLPMLGAMSSVVIVTAWLCLLSLSGKAILLSSTTKGAGSPQTSNDC